VSPLELFSDELETLVQRVAPGVVALEHRRGHGTALAISPDGYLLTNAHVVHNLSRLKVRFHDGARFEGEVVGRDEVTAVFRDVQVTVPLLALNRGTAAPPSGSTSLSLAPEDDGIAAAEYLLARQLRRVVVIQGTDDGMRRSSGALREHLQSSGGTVPGMSMRRPSPARPGRQARRPRVYG